MTAVAALSHDISISAAARTVVAPVPTVAAVATSPTATADKGQGFTTAAAKFSTAAAASTVESAPAAALQTRTVSFSDAATGILIQADQNATTGEVISQFPDRALIESYAQQMRMGTGVSAASSVNT